MHCCKAGEAWWLKDETLIAFAREEQEGRRDHDPWEPLIAKFIEGKSDVSIDEIFRGEPVPAGSYKLVATDGGGAIQKDINLALRESNAFGVACDPTKLKQADQNRVARCLKALQWEKYRTTEFAKMPGCAGFAKTDFTRAMERLFNKGILQEETHGPPSKRHNRLAAVEAKTTEKRMENALPTPTPPIDS